MADCLRSSLPLGLQHGMLTLEICHVTVHDHRAQMYFCTIVVVGVILVYPPFLQI